MKYDTSFPDEDREIVSLRFSCNLGNASCLMELKDYERANKYFKVWLLSPTYRKSHLLFNNNNNNQ